MGSAANVNHRASRTDQSVWFKMFKSFKPFKPLPVSSPASRGRRKGGGWNDSNVLNQLYPGGSMISVEGEKIEVIDAHSHMGSRNKLAVHQIPRIMKFTAEDMLLQWTGRELIKS